MAKGPAYFSPDRYPERARDRFAYVLKRMQEDNVAGTEGVNPGVTGGPRIVPYEKPKREGGFHFVDHLMREAKTLVGMASLTSESYTVRSTINSKLQRAVEEALQDGLARYDEERPRPLRRTGAEPRRHGGPRHRRAEHPRPTSRPHHEAGLADGARDREAAALRRALAGGRGAGPQPWSTAARSSASACRTAASCRCRLPDHVDSGMLHLNDVIFVNIVEGKKRSDAKAELRIKPKVQGAALVLENKTGRILAMVGGFSYPLSQLNRTTQALRQPGSSIKPLTYLAALHRGLQPNTLVTDQPVTLPPIPGVSTHYWTPKNYDGQSWGSMTLRRALENSKNLVTARLLEGGIDRDPIKSLDQICELALEARIYPECMKNYPFVLGAQALRMIDLSGFYASVANEGLRVTPYTIDTIEKNGHAVYRHQAGAPVYMAHGDRAGVLPASHHPGGVVARGTAAAMKQHAGFVGGKTGTTDNENDAWFGGFSSDIAVVVWVGYDNARGKQTLGRGGTGGSVAVPIAQADHRGRRGICNRPRRRCRRRRPRPGRYLKAMPIDLNSGQRLGFRQKRRLHRIFPARRAQEAARHSVCAGRTKFTGAGWANGRARHERRPAAATSGCYPAAQLRTGAELRTRLTDLARTECRGRCGNCFGFECVCDGGYINWPPFSGNIVGVSGGVGVTAMWIKTSTAALLVLTTTVALAASGGLPDRQGGVGRRARPSTRSSPGRSSSPIIAPTTRRTRAPSSASMNGARPGRSNTSS